MNFELTRRFPCMTVQVITGISVWLEAEPQDLICYCHKRANPIVARSELENKFCNLCMRNYEFQLLTYNTFYIKHSPLKKQLAHLTIRDFEITIRISQGDRLTGKPGKPGNDREFSVTWRNREMTGNFFVDREFLKIFNKKRFQIVLNVLYKVIYLCIILCISKFPPYFNNYFNNCPFRIIS